MSKMTRFAIAKMNFEIAMGRIWGGLTMLAKLPRILKGGK